jgi:hypothetical protein
VNASPEALQLYQGYIPHPPLPHEIDSEPCIQSHLNSHWLAGARVIIEGVLHASGIPHGFKFKAETYGSQLPDFWGMLTSGDGESEAGDGDAFKFGAIVEAKSETVMRALHEDLLERSRAGYAIIWHDNGSPPGPMTAKLMWKVSCPVPLVHVTDVATLMSSLKVAIYLGYSQRTWLCLTALSCMFVFRLVRHNDGTKPFLVMSKPIFVPDFRPGRTFVDDGLKGRLWMPALVATCLLEIDSEYSIIGIQTPCQPFRSDAAPPMPPEWDSPDSDTASESEGTSISSDSYSPSSDSNSGVDAEAS